MSIISFSSTVELGVSYWEVDCVWVKQKVSIDNHRIGSVYTDRIGVPKPIRSDPIRQCSHRVSPIRSDWGQIGSDWARPLPAVYPKTSRSAGLKERPGRQRGFAIGKRAWENDCATT